MRVERAALAKSRISPPVLLARDIFYIVKRGST
jgi:hypothetical protein